MRVLKSGSVPNASGSTGASVNVTVPGISGDTVSPLFVLAPNYQVFLTPNQASVFASVSAKTSTSFVITLTPLAANAVAAGLVDYAVIDFGQGQY
jgi:hypothetical protein